MKPPKPLSVTDRQRFRELELQQAGTVPAGRVMFCRGRKVLDYADVADLVNVFNIPKGADTMCVSPADINDIKEWLA